MAKRFTFAAIHFTAVFTIAYALADSVAVAAAIALIEPVCNTVAYFFHEKVWQKFEQTQDVEFIWGIPVNF